MVEYRWKQYDPVNILNMELAEFDLTKTEYSIKDVEYVAGIHHCEFVNGLKGPCVRHRIQWIGFCRSSHGIFPGNPTPKICTLLQKNHEFVTYFKIPEVLP